MKKIYESPVTTIVAVELHKMIASSVGMGGSYNGTADIEARDGYDWDDED